MTKLLRQAAVAAAIVVAACGSGESAPNDDPADPGPLWVEGPRLPQPVGNNGVAAIAGEGRVTVLSVLGVGPTKRWDAVTAAAFRWDLGVDEAWREISPVPGPGRLAPTVEVVGGRAYVFGGYTVAEDGSEQSMPHVDVYDPGADRWTRAAPIPLPVDDAVSGIASDSTIYLVSGWHDGRNVADVQIYDPAADAWTAAAPIPGAPVFGHSGGIAEDRIVYVGGARIVDAQPRFVADTAAWLGRIDSDDPSAIDWEAIPLPPGLPLYRSAAGVIGGFVSLIGGSPNPYNYSGIGYDGRPSEPEHQLVAYDPGSGWLTLEAPPVATMDHRNFGVAGGYVFVVGGMEAGQRVSDRVWYAEVDRLLATARVAR